MYYVACTRFNNATYNENKSYRKKHNIGTIYGPAYKIRASYPIGSLIFVAEMNIETNKIEGIGLIKNCLVVDKPHRIYQNWEYNRHIYSGHYWISRDDISTLDQDIIDILENILFKGKSHMKKGAGISVLTKNIFTHWNCDLDDLKNKVKTAFLVHFRNDDEFNF